MRLGHLRDRASDMGHRKEYPFSCIIVFIYKAALYIVSIVNFYWCLWSVNLLLPLPSVGFTFFFSLEEASVRIVLSFYVNWLVYLNQYSRLGNV